jgi:hypothetical protein
MLYSGSLRLGSTTYRPIPGLGNKLTAKATLPSASAIIPAPGSIKVTPVPGLKPINFGSKLTPKTTLPTGTAQPTTPATPANPSTTKAPTNVGPYAANVTFGRDTRWNSQTVRVAAATSPTDAPGAAAIECGGRTEDGGYLTWQQAFKANGEPQLLCVRVFN